MLPLGVYPKLLLIICQQGNRKSLIYLKNANSCLVCDTKTEAAGESSALTAWFPPIRSNVVAMVISRLS